MTQASKPRTFSADLAQLPIALQWLTTRQRWVVWRWEVSGVDKTTGEPKWTKPPFQPAFPGTHASSKDASTWGSYQEALAAVAAGKADGIGVMLLDGEVAAADLDHCRDPDTGELTEWAQYLYAEATRFGLYVEVTVTGTGLRFIGLSHQGKELHRRFPFNRSNGEGLELYRGCARFITISGLQEGQCETMGEIDDLSRHAVGSALRSGIRSRHQYRQSSTSTLPARSKDHYHEILENGAPQGERSEQFAEVVWHLASSGLSIEEIDEEITKHPNGIGAKYAGRLLAEVTRCYEKWRSQRLAAVTGTAGGPAGGAAPPPGGGSAYSAAGAVSGWPQIQVVPSELPRVVNEAEDALLGLNREFYQRGGLMVRPILNRSLKASDDRETASWQLLQVTRPHLVEALCCAAQFQRYDKTQQEMGSDGCTEQGRRDLSQSARQLAVAVIGRRGEHAVHAGRRLDLREAWL